LETERLLLRPPEANDLDALAALGADPDVMRYIGPGTTYSRAVAEEWLARLLEEGRVGVPGPPGLPGWLVVIVKAGGGWAGLAALKILAGQHAEAIGIDPAVELGYRLGQHFWGQGYATEAAGALVRYGFEELGLPLITAIADARNQSSNRVLGKAGLVYRKTYTLDGRTILFHSLSREEFRRATAGGKSMQGAP
jgi:RimJ/RimL family protein N-acetyltransferase